MADGRPSRSVAELRRRRPPARIVHLGLGAFARAHAFWYTQHAPDGAEWGIAGFTGRSPAVADTLSAQEGVYSLIERGDDDRIETIDALVTARSGTDADALVAAIADPATAIVTLTITENGYAPGSPALDRLAAALDARCRANAGPIALVPCDNLPGNGAVLSERLAAVARPGLADWLDASVSFVSTVVDRITPATTDTDVAEAARLLGARDAAPVVTEPYSAWTLAGDFPAGRPDWAASGAEFVDDAEPAEHRKLWLLNGSHSLLAYRGLALGHTTVAEAMADDRCAAEVERLWSEDAAVLPYDAAEVDRYTAELRARYANARIEHRLEQVALDGSAKLGPRILDPLRARRDAGLAPGEAQAGVVAAWTRHVAAGRADADAGAADLGTRLDGRPPRDQARTVLEALAPDLAADGVVVDAVVQSLEMTPS